MALFLIPHASVTIEEPIQDISISQSMSIPVQLDAFKVWSVLWSCVDTICELLLTPLRSDNYALPVQIRMPIL
ncbi:hypothetical protein EYC84_003100 [Monilinia fructicola]|uniref:Uncharacterized protein n=1 Tax=Monilinia fructicola TaxID=38448 RepID=A0A5M9JV40_MONFR|nr:hypothetical protein EYC84_003100 [Monilinia fructicola]